MNNQPPLRIAVVAEVCNSKSGARAPIELANALAKNNHVFFYARKINHSLETEHNLNHHGVTVRLLCKKKPSLSEKIASIFFLKNKLRKDKIEVISAHCKLPFLIGCKMSQAPIVKTYHGKQFNPLNEKILPNSSFRLLVKITNPIINCLIYIKSLLIAALPSQFVAISNYTSREFKRLFGHLPPYIYWGGEQLSLTKINSREDQKINNKTQFLTSKSKDITILSVSRFTPYKGFHHLIEVFKKLSETHSELKLVIVGSLGSRKYLNYLKKNADTNIDFLVNCSDKKLAEKYLSCDIYATCDRYLFFGMPILEAAHFGKPAVALDYCAATEIIEDKQTGFLAQNLEEMGASLERLIQEPKLRNKMGDNAQQRAKEMFTWEKTAEEYEKIFAEVVSS